MKAPPGILTGKQWKERRGDKSDEECIDQICELVAAGVYLKAAFPFVGVPPATWFRWRRGNKQILDKFDFAFSVGIMLRCEEIFEIADAPIGDRRYDENGNLVSASVGEELANRKVMIDVRKWFLEAMAPRLNLKGIVNVSLNQEINLPESMTPQDAMREYIKLIEAKPR